jgi:hypothetical protein
MLSAIQPTVFNSLRKFGILESVGSENVFAGTALAIENVSNSGTTIMSANETSADAPGDANTA